MWSVELPVSPCVTTPIRIHVMMDSKNSRNQGKSLSVFALSQAALGQMIVREMKLLTSQDLGVQACQAARSRAARWDKYDVRRNRAVLTGFLLMKMESVIHVGMTRAHFLVQVKPSAAIAW